MPLNSQVFFFTVNYLIWPVPGQHFGEERGEKCFCSVVYMWHLVHVCLSWERDPSTWGFFHLFIPLLILFIYFFNITCFSSLESRVWGQRMFFTVQFLKPTEAMWLLGNIIKVDLICGSRSANCNCFFYPEAVWSMPVDNALWKLRNK